MLQPGRNVSAANYRYGFNGKENDNEVKGDGNQQDYGMRIYDPRVGRFLSVDPLTKKYPSVSPYKSFNNNPIIFSDPSGGTEYLTIKINNVQTGKTTVITKVVSTNLYPKEVMVTSSAFGLNTHSTTKKWDWYDKEHTINLVVDNGVITNNSYSEKLVGTPERTSIKSEIWAKVNKYGVQGNGGEQPGGFHLTVEGGGADPTKNKAQHPEYVKADALLAAIGAITKGRDLPDISIDGLPDFINSLASVEQQRQSMQEGSANNSTESNSGKADPMFYKKGNVIFRRAWGPNGAKVEIEDSSGNAHVTDKPATDTFPKDPPQ